MADVTGIFIIMFIVASAAFAPLGYFIYKYTKDNSDPFGNTEPHGDSPSATNDLAEKAIHFVKSRIGKK